MKYKIDHPHVRAMYACPMCGESKPIGNVTCWPCHNETEFGTDGQRDFREACIDEAERIEIQNNSQFGVGA